MFLDQLFEEMHNISQKSHENVFEYRQRLDQQQSRIVVAVHASEADKSILKGKLLMIGDICLNRFIYHTNAQISQMLRYRNFINLDNAFTAAIAEEKALRLRSRISSNHPAKNMRAKIFQVSCTYCDKSGHSISNCRSKPNKNCNYCKKNGHTINECQKREQYKFNNF